MFLLLSLRPPATGTKHGGGEGRSAAAAVAAAPPKRSSLHSPPLVGRFSGLNSHNIFFLTLLLARATERMRDTTRGRGSCRPASQPASQSEDEDQPAGSIVKGRDGPRLKEAGAGNGGIGGLGRGRFGGGGGCCGLTSEGLRCEQRGWEFRVVRRGIK